MPILYRRWAAVRLSDLQPWIDLWSDGNMFAGIQGRSAEDAWYLTSLDSEHSQVFNEEFIGGALDLYKCFDQIIRLLLYCVLLLAAVSYTHLTLPTICSV
eukprot:6322247-Karenia_brevis.AAC.1